jgi:energy-coupling factor transporter ATP-binding protein EcfA2
LPAKAAYLAPRAILISGRSTFQLSGGERLKIALAAQLYAQQPPQLLLLYEPDSLRKPLNASLH